MTNIHGLKRKMKRKLVDLLKAKKINKSKFTAALTLLLSSTLAVPAYANIIFYPDPVDQQNGATNNIVIGAGQTWTTLAGTANAANGASYQYVSIASGGIWRPMELRAAQIGIAGNPNPMNLATLIMDNGSVDLAYAFTHNLSRDQFGAIPSDLIANPRGYRLVVANATLLGDNVFRLNANISAVNNNLNSISRVELQDAAGSGNIYIQLAYNSKISENLSGVGTEVFRDTALNKYEVLSIGNGKENFNVDGQSAKMDGRFSVYEVLPYIEWDQSTGKAYLLGYATFDTGLINETGKMAIDSQLAYRNLWRIEESNIFWRPNTLRRLHMNDKLSNTRNLSGDSAIKEGVWATVYRGKMKSDSLTGRSIGQTYDGIMVGMDKEREGDFFNGKLYQGFFLSMLSGKTSFATGSGNQDSYGVGMYNTWLGNRGHHVDFIARIQKIEGKYHYLDGNSVAKEAELNNWAYGLSAQYGYRKTFRSGVYIEPQVGLSYGKVSGRDYKTHEAARHTPGGSTNWGDPTNYLGISQGNINAVTGRLGFIIGKNFGEQSNPSEIYLRTTLWKEFGDTGEVSGKYGTQSRVFKKKDTQKDTWVEFNLGTNIKTSHNTDLFAEVSKTFGGDVKTDWQVSGGFSWHWDAAPKKKDSGYTQSMDNGKDPVMNSLTKTYLSDNQMTAETAVNINNENISANVSSNDVQAGGSGNTNIATVNGDLPTYALEPITVEARRPDWEQKLSPGTVSVVYPEDFKGEQKTLPEYLETVPGVHIHRLQGTGKYSVARVRGSTASQVGVYVDGVRMNLDSEAAFDLSTIPTENVARIEVYRGYVPARFAGAPMGGVINVVTKRPTKFGGSVSQGFRDVGSAKKTNMEFTMPLGSGSMMAAWNWEEDDGDFKYHNYAAERYNQRNPGGPDFYSADRRRMNNGFKRSDYLVKWQDENWLVKVQHRNNFTRSGSGLPDNDLTGHIGDNPTLIDNIEFNGRLDINQTDILLGRRQTTGNLEWGVQFEYTKQQKKFRRNKFRSIHMPGGSYPGAQWGDYNTKRYGGSLDGTWKLGSSHLLEFYLGYTKEDYDNYLSVPSGNHINYNNARAGRYFQNKRYHFQIQDTIALDRAKTLFITPVIKMDRVDMGALMSRQAENENQWKRSIGVGLKKQFGEAWMMKASWGRYNRYPNFYEIFGDGYLLNPAGTRNTYDLTWETGTNMDIGVSWNGKAIGAKSNFTVTYFHNIFRDMIELNQSIHGASWYNNGGDGWAKGIELEGKMHWKRFDLSFAATYTKSKKTKYNQFIGVNDGSQVGLQLFNIPEWEGFRRQTIILITENGKKACLPSTSVLNIK